MIEPWGKSSDGQDVKRITLKGGDLTASIITYGATVQDLRLTGHDAPLVLGLESIAAYEDHRLYFGAIVGRCANRIAQGKFKLDGKTYDLQRRAGDAHHLHGGSDGFFARVWTIEDASASQVTLRLESADGDMGYPGNLIARCTYRLSDDNGLEITLQAESDAPTICNLVNHSYFNLEDGGQNDVCLHRLQIEASRYLDADETHAPTGALIDVSGTNLDFRHLRPIGDFTAYDHNMCLAYQRGPLREVARLVAPSSGVVMDVLTTETGLQIYGGAYLSPISGLDGINYSAGSAVCLEAQIWPDAINHEAFPNAVLRLGEKLEQKTLYRLSRRAEP